MTRDPRTCTKLPCPGCKRSLKVPYRSLGTRLCCGHCQHRFEARFGIDCPGCSRSLPVRPECYGALARCKFCRHTFRIKVPVRCPECRRSCGIKPEEIGKPVRCASCSHRFTVGPIPDQQPPLQWFQVAALVADMYREELQRIVALPTPAQGRTTRLDQGQTRALHLLKQQMAAARSERDTLQTRWRTLRAEAEALRTQRDQLEKHLADARASHEAAEHRWQRALEDARALWEAEATTHLLGLRAEAERERTQLERRLQQERERSASDKVLWQEKLRQQDEAFARERAELLAEVGQLREAHSALGHDARSLEGQLRAEAERLARELADALQHRDQERRDRLETEARLVALSEQLASWRAEAAELGLRLHDALLVCDEQRTRAQRLEQELTEQRRESALTRQERDAALAEAAALGVQLGEVSAQARQDRDELEQVRQAAALEKERLEQALLQARQEQEATMRLRKDLTGQVERLKAELVAAREAQTAGEMLLGDTSRQLELLSRERQEQLDRANELEQQLLARAVAAEADRQDWLRQKEQLEQTLGKQIEALQAEVQRLQDAVRTGTMAASPAQPVADDTFWEMVASGGLSLPKPVAPPKVQPGVVHRRIKVEPVAPPKPDYEPLRRLLRAVGGLAIPPREEVDQVLRGLGDRAISTILEVVEGGDIVIRRGAARVCQWLAFRSRKLKTFPHAGAAAEQGVKLFKQLSVELPGDHTLRGELAAAYLLLGQCQMRLRQGTEAIRSLGAAREASETLVREQPRVAPYRRVLARALHDIAVLLTAADRRAEAVGCLRLALRHQAELVRGWPQAADYAADLKRLHSALQRCQGSPTRSGERKVVAALS